MRLGWPRGTGHSRARREVHSIPCGGVGVARFLFDHLLRRFYGFTRLGHTVFNIRASRASNIATVLQIRASGAIDVATVLQIRAPRAFDVATVLQIRASRAFDVATVPQIRPYPTVDAAMVLQIRAFRASTRCCDRFADSNIPRI